MRSSATVTASMPRNANGSSILGGKQAGTKEATCGVDNEAGREESVAAEPTAPRASNPRREYNKKLIRDFHLLG